MTKAKKKTADNKAKDESKIEMAVVVLEGFEAPFRKTGDAVPFFHDEDTTAPFWIPQKKIVKRHTFPGEGPNVMFEDRRWDTKRVRLYVDATFAHPLVAYAEKHFEKGQDFDRQIIQVDADRWADSSTKRG